MDYSEKLIKKIVQLSTWQCTNCKTCQECHEANDGRDGFAIYLRRQKLPDRIDVNQPGHTFIGDNYLTCDEITPDTGIYAYGRVYDIQGVDEFTQRFYRERYQYDFPLGAV